MVPFYYADELAMHLEGTIESLNEVSDSAYEVRPEATEYVLAAVPRYVTSWEAGGKQTHTLANVVFPIMRLQDFLERAATMQKGFVVVSCINPCINSCKRLSQTKEPATI